MKQKNVIVGVLLLTGVVLLGVSAYLFTSQSDGGRTQEVGENGGTLSNMAQGEPTVVVTRTKDGYEPKEITIKKGDIVEWVNESDEYHWPASDLHPTHGVYPAFDPLDAIAPDQTWKFQFDEVGVWKYHDHVRANKTGTVTVTE